LRKKHGFGSVSVSVGFASVSVSVFLFIPADAIPSPELPEMGPICWSHIRIDWSRAFLQLCHLTYFPCRQKQLSVGHVSGIA